MEATGEKNRNALSQIHSNHGTNDPKVYAQHQETKQQLNRSFGLFSLLGLAFAILNTWTAAAASISLVLPSGGPSAALWGMLTSGLCTLCMAASLGEMCSVFPTVGGQYHFAALLSSPKWAAFNSYITGWFAVAGWWALVGTNGSLAGQLITGIVSLYHPDYTINRWLIYVVYAAWVAIAFCINAFAVRGLPYINSFSLFWSLLGVIAIIVTILVTSRGNHQPASFLFSSAPINETGWPVGVAWILGLLQSAFALTAFDSVMHLAEEVPRPEWNCPIAMVAAILIGTTTGFGFLVAFLFSISDYQALLSAVSPLLTGYNQATNNRVGATCLLVISIGCQLFAATGAVTTAGRMSWAFARDGGLPASRLFSGVVPGLDVPLMGLILGSVIPIAYGAIYIGSTSALNAILSSSVIMLNISYGYPIAILLIRGRKVLHIPGAPKPAFRLGIFGYLANIIALLFIIVTSVFFCFPPFIPVTALSMNYAAAVVVLILLVALFMWLFKRKTFTGPRDIDGLLLLARHGLAKGQTINDVLYGKTEAQTFASGYASGETKKEDVIPIEEAEPDRQTAEAANDNSPREEFHSPSNAMTPQFHQTPYTSAPTSPVQQAPMPNMPGNDAPEYSSRGYAEPIVMDTKRKGWSLGPK